MDNWSSTSAQSPSVQNVRFSSSASAERAHGAKLLRGRSRDRELRFGIRFADPYVPRRSDPRLWPRRSPGGSLVLWYDAGRRSQQLRRPGNEYRPRYAILTSTCSLSPSTRPTATVIRSMRSSARTTAVPGSVCLSNPALGTSRAGSTNATGRPSLVPEGSDEQLRAAAANTVLACVVRTPSSLWQTTIYGRRPPGDGKRGKPRPRALNNFGTSPLEFSPPFDYISPKNEGD